MTDAGFAVTVVVDPAAPAGGVTLKLVDMDDGPNVASPEYVAVSV